MSGTKGALHFEATMGNDDIKRKLAEMRQGLLDSGKTAEAEGAKIEGMFKRMATGAVAYLSAQQAISLGGDIIRVRGEIQMMEKSFEVLLGGKANAMKMIAEIKQLAIDSPLEMPQVSGAVQTLLGFGVSAEKVMGIVGQLSDVSMGNADRFRSLALVYAQCQSAGKLMGQDLLQMINAGFNPLQIIAEKTGRSIGELKEDMSRGAISAEMVADAFATVTSEGGKFYQMTQKQADGIVGLQATFEDAITNQMNKFGEKNEELIADGFRFATSVVENADVIGKALGTLVVAYGTYKAAIIATNVVQSVITSAQYSVEIAELSKLLPIKQAIADADIKEAVASGRLTQAKAEQLLAIRAKVQAQLEELKLSAQQAIIDVQNAKISLQNTGYAISASREKIQSLRLEQSASILNGDATKANALQEQIYAERKNLSTLKTTAKTQATNIETLQETASTRVLAAKTLRQNIDTAATVAATRAKNIFTAATVRLSSAMKALKVAFMSNPIGMIITLLTTAVSAMYAFFDNTKEAVDVTAELNSQLTLENSKVDILFGRLNSASKGTKEYDNAKKSILDSYGSYLQGLGSEITSLENVKLAYDAVKKAARESIIERLRAEKVGEASATAQEGFESAYDNIFNDLKGRLKSGKKDLANTIMPIIREALEAENTTVLSDAEASYNRVLTALQNTFGKQGGASMFNSISGGVKDWLETSKQWKTEIEEIDAKLAPVAKKLNNDKTDVVFSPPSEQLKKEIQNIAELEQKIKDIRSGKIKTNSAAKDIEDATKALKEAQSRYNLLSGIDKETGSTDHIKEAKEHQLAIEQAKIDAMDEGSAKQLAQIDLNHKKEIDKLTEQKASLLKLAQEKGDTKTTTKINTDFKILTGAADDKALRERAEVTKSMLELIVKDMEKSINDQIDLTNLEYDSNLEYLEKYGDTQQKKFAITQRYNGLILEAKTESQKKILEQERDQALSGADMEGLQKSDLSQLFGNLDNLTLPSMEGLRDKIKAWIDGAGKELSPEDFKAVMDAFQKLDLKIADKNPFGELMVAGQEYKTATQEVAQAQANLNDLQAKGVTSGKQYEAAQATLTTAQNNQATAVTKQQQAINSVADKGKQILGAAQDVLGILGDLGVKVPEEIANALSGVGQILDGFGSMDLTKPLSIVTGAVKMLGGLVKSVTSLFGGSNETLEELERRQKEYREKAYLAELEINQLYRDRYDWAQKIGESNLSYIKRQGEELKKQSTDNAKEQDDLMAKLYATDYKSGEHFEKTGLFGWGKGKIVEDRSSLEGKSWEEIEKLAASGALSEEGMKYYEALKKAREEGENLIAREQQYLESVRELTTGSTYEGVVNGIVEGFKAGKRSAADFADSFEGLLNGAIESALNSLANEKSRAWYEKFAEMGKDGYTEDELAELKADWIKLNEELAEDAKNLENVTGGTIGGGQTNEKSLTGQIRGSVATEASVAELGGIFRGQYDKLSSINSQLDLGFKQIAEMAKLQADIAANTGKTASNTDGLGARIDATNTKLDTLIKQTTKDTGDYGG